MSFMTQCQYKCVMCTLEIKAQMDTVRVIHYNEDLALRKQTSEF